MRCLWVRRPRMDDLVSASEHAELAIGWNCGRMGAYGCTAESEPAGISGNVGFCGRYWG
jgi:hypothetical protein